MSSRSVVEPRPPSNPIVPGGGLAAHEAAGGRTLAAHVGRSIEDLRDVLREQPYRRWASTFASRALAEAALAETLNVHKSRIGAWAARPAPGDLAVEHRVKLPAGFALARGAATAEPASLVRAVLRCDARWARGWRVLVAYPDAVHPAAGPRREALRALLAPLLHQAFDPGGHAIGEAALEAVRRRAARLGVIGVKGALGDLEATLLGVRDDEPRLQACLDACGVAVDVADAEGRVRAWMLRLREEIVSGSTPTTPPDREGVITISIGAP